MNHEQTQELLSDYLDGELDARESAAAVAHLSDCADCRAELARYRRADAALRAATPPPTALQTAAFVRAVRKRLEAAPEAAFLASWLASPRFAVPAFVLAFAGLIAAVLPPRADAGGLAEALLVARGGSGTYAWLSKSDAAAASAFDWEAP